MASRFRNCPSSGKVSVASQRRDEGLGRRRAQAGASRNPEVFSTMLPTVLGEFRAEFTSRGLRALDFPGCANAREPGPVEEAPAVFGPLIQQTQEALDRTARGGRPDRLPSLDWSGATAFQRTVWRELLRIPPGTIRSYGEIARRIGRPGASRAVGAACGANPIPVLVPCHRVLASSGALGGFSAGPDWKRRLLAREGIYPTRASSRA